MLLLLLKRGRQAPVRFSRVAGRTQSGEKGAFTGRNRGVGAATDAYRVISEQSGCAVMGFRFCSGKRPAQQTCSTPSGLLTFALVLLFCLPALPVFAARLGGAYYVDDAEIGRLVPARLNPGVRLPRVGIE